MSYLVGIDPTLVRTNTEGPAFTLGTIGQILDSSAGTKTYKYVQYVDGTGPLSLAVGDVVIYVDDSGYGAHQVTADVSDITGKEIGAGVTAVAMTAVTHDLGYFWIQIRGAATLAVDIGGAGSDGDQLTAVGAADKGLTLALDAGAAADSVGVCAIIVDETADEIICMFPE